MLIGYGLSSLIMPFYAFVISPVQVLYLRFAERVGKGVRTAPRDSLISDKVGKEKMLAVGYLVYAVVYFGFGWSSDVKAIMGLFALYGLYSAMTDGTQKAFVSDLVDSDKKGTGLGIYNALIGLTLLPASLLAGILYDKVNADVPFYFGGAMSLLAALMLFVLILTDKRRFKN